MAKIRNKSEQVAKLILEGVNTYTLEYGDLSKGANSRVDLEITSETPLINVRAEASCGCTNPVLTNKGDVYNLTIAYDTNRPGSFSKNVYFRHGINKNRTTIVINLKGKVA